jgi:hypothetical protein
MSHHHENIPLSASEGPLFVSSFNDLHEFQIFFFFFAALIIDAFEDNFFTISEFVLHFIIMLSLLIYHHLVDLRLLNGLIVLSLSVIVHKVIQNMLHH